MISKNICVVNKFGIHARPSALLMHEGKKYQSNISISKNNKTIDLSSIMKILNMQIEENDNITITADGPDEQDALQAICKLIESGFGEK